MRELHGCCRVFNLAGNTTLRSRGLDLDLTLAHTTAQFLKAFTTAETAYRRSYGMGDEKNPTPVSVPLLTSLATADQVTGARAGTYPSCL